MKLSSITISQKEVSPTLQNLIDKANATFGKAKEIVMAAYNQAIADGFTKDEAKELIFAKITVFKKSTLYSCIPAEAKDSKQRNRRLNKPTKNPVPKLEPPQDQDHANNDEDSRIERLPDQENATEQWQQQAASQNELEELRRQTVELKKPFVVETTLEIRGQTIPVVIEAVPSKKLASVMIDEVKARRLVA